MHERGADYAPNVSSPKDPGKVRRAAGCQGGQAHDGFDAAACPASAQCSTRADRTSPMITKSALIRPCRCQPTE